MYSTVSSFLRRVYRTRIVDHPCERLSVIDARARRFEVLFLSLALIGVQSRSLNVQFLAPRNISNEPRQLCF